MTGRLSTDQNLSTLYSDVERYYSKKIETYGATPLGVDWSCLPTQELRFVQLLRLCDFQTPFSLNDIGCGYGALLAFLAKRHRRHKIDYLGTDLSMGMVAEARERWNKRPNTEFLVTTTSPRTADYSVASGIFNVKLKTPQVLWELFISKTLASMHATSRRGFAVNFLCPLAEGATSQQELYRPPPELWKHHCEQTFGLRVELFESYGLREYTLLARPR